MFLFCFNLLLCMCLATTNLKSQKARTLGSAFSIGWRIYATVSYPGWKHFRVPKPTCNEEKKNHDIEPNTYSDKWGKWACGSGL